MELLTPKVQINVSHRTNAAGEILERSTLLNIRTDDVLEAIQLFNQLRIKMNGQDQFMPPSIESSKPVTSAVSPVEAKPQSYNWPFESSEPAPQCPACSSRMVKRNGKNGIFWGCSNYSRGCKGTCPIEQSN